MGGRRGRGRGRGLSVQRGGRAELAGYSGGGPGGGGPPDYGAEEGECGGGEEGEGVDFGGCQEDPDNGFCCVEKLECVNSLSKDPILECTHKNVEQCHYTYVTQFTPAQQEVCEENFEKICSITFKQQAYNETIEKCYTPVEKVCNGQGEEECKTVYESACTTKYVEKQPGKFVADTKCEKLPTELCGAGCTYEEGPKECHDKVVTSLVDSPEEVCDLNPQKTCRFVTKLVPKLKPTHECTIVPKETCILKFTTPKQVKKPLVTKWCLDPSEPLPGDSYEEEKAYAPVLGSGSSPQSYGVPAPRQPGSGYGAPETPEEDYSAPARDYSGPRQAAAPVYNERRNNRRNNKKKNKKKSKKGGNRKKVKSSQNYLAPPSDSFGASFDYEEDYIDQAARDDYSGPVQPAVQAARDFSVPSNSYRGPTPASGDYGAPPSSANRDYSAPSGDYGSPSNDNYGAPTEVEEDYSSPNQNYGSPNPEYSSPTSPSRDYASPSSSSRDYASPSPSSPSRDYSSPSSASRDYSSPAVPSRDYSSPSSPENDYSSPTSPSRDYGSPSSQPPSRDYSSPSSQSPRRDYSSPSPSSPGRDYSSPPSDYSSAGGDYSAPSRDYSSPGSLDGYGATSEVSIDFSPSQPVYSNSPLQAAPSYNRPQYVSLDGAAPQMLVRRSKALNMVHSPFSMPRSFFHG